MTWLWIALAFIGGTVFGIAFGRKARMYAYYHGTVDGYKEGLHHGWMDALEAEEADDADTVMPVNPDDVSEGYKLWLESIYGGKDE